MAKTETKICHDCFRLLPIEQFHMDKYAKGGRRTMCKACAIKRSNKWQRENLNHKLLYHKIYRQVKRRKAETT